MTVRASAPTLSAPSVAMLLTALGSGVLFGARPRNSSRQGPVALLALALLGIAAHRPLAEALKKAGSRRRAADLLFSFVVDRPVEQVFAFCADFENFPRFIRSLREVRDTGDGRSHWCATTPSGGEIEWNAVTTKFVTNSVIGWRSVPGAPVDASGLLRFKNEGGRTCVHVTMRYRVIDGGMTDALAALVQPSRASELQRDIPLLEQHIARADLEEPAGVVTG